MTRGSGLVNSMRIFWSRRTKIWPISVEVSFTTSVYLMCSMSAVRLRKSDADLSIICRTLSVVQRGLSCAVEAHTCSTPANAQSPSNATKETAFFKLNPCCRKDEPAV